MLYKNLVIRAGEAPEKVVERLNEELANGWHSSSSISFGGIMIITLEYTDPRIHSLNAKALDLVEVVAAGIEEAIEKIEPTLIEQAKVEVKALFRGAVTEGARNAIGNRKHGSHLLFFYRSLKSRNFLTQCIKNICFFDCHTMC